MTSDHKKPGETPSLQIEMHIQQRILLLAQDFSALEISRMRGMPDAQTLYLAIASDPIFKERFLKANNQYHRSRRAAVVDLLKRCQQLDLSRVLVELRKLKTRSLQCSEQNSGEYDLTLLSKDELIELERILRKAVPGYVDNSDSKQSTEESE